MFTKILFEAETKQKIKDGVNLVANAVKGTLGRGKFVILGSSYGVPEICDDGVSIIKNIELEDEGERMGAEIVKEVAVKTNDSVGDGTTTSIIFVQELLNRSLDKIAEGNNPLDIKAGLEKGLGAIKENLSKIIIPISSQEQIQQIAVISSQNEEIGKLIADSIKEVGKNGTITIEEFKGFGNYKEIVKGFKIENGYLSPYFITNPEFSKVELDNCVVAVIDGVISSIQDVVPILEENVRIGNPAILIIAEDFKPDALATLIINRIKMGLNVLAIKASGFGDRQKDLLQDISLMVGGQLISEETGNKLSNITSLSFGKAKKVISTKDNTIIISGKEDNPKVKEKIEQLKNSLKEATSDFDKDKIQERISNLSEGIGIIKIGGLTEIEQKNKQKKAEDALNSTKSAIEEGIVSGGGISYLEMIKFLEKVILPKEKKVGLDILKDSLARIVKQLAENVGKNGDEVLNKIIKLKSGMGFNVQNLKYENMIKAGIIDSAKMVRISLENAISAISILINSNVIVVEKNKDIKNEQ